MRLLAEIGCLILLVFVTWDKPLRESLGAKPPTIEAPPVVVAAPTPRHGDWMWNPTRTTTLDRPAHDEKRNVARAPDYFLVPSPTPTIGR